MEGKNVAFLFTDTQIVVETMLEDLNNVLNSGEIPNLFPQDEQVGDKLSTTRKQKNGRPCSLAHFWFAHMKKLPSFCPNGSKNERNAACGVKYTETKLPKHTCIYHWWVLLCAPSACDT